MDARLPRGLVEWAYGFDGARAFAVRHFLLVFIPISLVSVIAEGAADSALLWPWAAAVGLATFVGLIAYLAAGRLISLIRVPLARGALAPLVYGLSGLLRGVMLVMLTDELAPLDESRAAMRIVWNALAGLVLLSAVVIADRELSDVIALQSSVNHRRRERQRLEHSPGVEEVVEAWMTELRAEVVRRFGDVSIADRRSMPETAAARVRDDLDAALDREAARAAEGVAPARISFTSAEDRRALVTLAAASLERVSLPLAAVIAVAVAALHDLDGVDAVEIATLLSGTVVAMAVTVVLVPVVAAAYRRLPSGAPTAAHVGALSVGLLLIGLAAALGDLEVDRLVSVEGDPVDPAFVIPRTMLAALLAGWAWMVILGLGPYADALREENRRESQVVVKLAAERLHELERAADDLRHGIEDAIASATRAVVAEGGEWYSPATRERLLEALEGAGAVSARPRPDA